MSRDFVNALCAALAGAKRSDPWGGGHDAWKVDGKMFATVGAMGEGVSLKTPDVESATMLIELDRARKARYFHRSWIFIPFDRIGPDDISEDELRQRIRISYDVIHSKLPKKVQAALKE